VNILLVEDELLLAVETAEMLISFGHNVNIASNAESALEKLSESDDYDVLVSDMKMPGMSGLDLIIFARKKFFADRENTRFILVSGHLSASESAEKLAALNIDFLPKPVSARSLLAALEP